MTYALISTGLWLALGVVSAELFCRIGRREAPDPYCHMVDVFRSTFGKNAEMVIFAIFAAAGPVMAGLVSYLCWLWAVRAARRIVRKIRDA
ncbi:MAG: hypothetical protein OEU92_22285 [Alphaproteobacteria bacterium]|nr:hypothetical protein [Alphaproteobacteria bacterium]